jgi:hypothetical protein
MTCCPECFSTQIEILLAMRDDRQDDEHLVTITKYMCGRCGCEFQCVERWEIEILRHGQEPQA